ncbi:MAG: UDP-N-acetylmuramoyl-tripeptide--D-alanyl-D-alanine ligase [Spirochaetia bacterium]
MGGEIISYTQLLKTVMGKPFIFRDGIIIPENPREDRPLGSVVIDSRKCREGSLFVPLPGTVTDGHRHIGDAFKRGAAVSLAAENELQKLPEYLRNSFSGIGHIIAVPDPLKALQDAAGAFRQSLTGVHIFGITGSSGKTTTKELLGSVFSRWKKTYMTEGNFNSDIGLPLSIFGLSEDTDYGIFEAGINYPGEMDGLVRILQPESVIITNIGSAHAGPLGGKEGIAREKRKLISGSRNVRQVFIHEDEPFLDFLAAETEAEIFRYGKKTTPGIGEMVSLGSDGTVINWEGLRINLSLPGGYNGDNALGVIRAAQVHGVSPEAVKEGIESVRPLFGRSEVIRGKITLIRDCYNANPESVKQALELLGSAGEAGRKIAVIGSMKELGAYSVKAHTALGALIAQSGASAVFLFGEETLHALEGLGETGFQGLAKHYTDYEVLQDEFIGYVHPGDTVLLKGSRSNRLERLADTILETYGMAVSNE